MSISEQARLRREDREALFAAGYQPYPATTYPVNSSTAHIRQHFSSEKEADFSDISLAGRLMARRLMGAASFAELQDSRGRLQLYIRRDTLCPDEDKSLYNEVFKKRVSIGDIIGVRGRVFRTQKGEVSLEVQEFRLLCKSLRPLPIVKRSESEQGELQVHDAFTDPEQRYRQRYVDLTVNPDIRKVFVGRTRLVDTLRSFLNKKGYLEVETPILQPVWGGAAARPFKTEHKALGIPLYLRIANELYLKRLIVGGFDAVYEFSKDFRNEGMSRFHNPEFTQIELYVAYKDYIWMSELVEEILVEAVKALHGRTDFVYQGQKIDFARPWARTTFYGAIEQQTGLALQGATLAELQAAARKLGVSVEPDNEARLLDKIFGHCCEPHFVQPTFVMDYPVALSPLAKQHRTKEGLVERFELICNGKEICNAYSELNDPIVQRQRLEAQLKLAQAGDEEAPSVLDEDFLRALEYGMPPTAGLGMGIDRLAMLLLDAASIQDVLFFPQTVLGDAETYYTRGVEYLKKGEYEEAIADFNKAIALRPDFAEAYSKRGEAYYAQKRYKEAIAEYSKAIGLRPDFAEAYSNRGAAYFAQRNYEQAIADFNEAIKLKPDDATAYSNRGAAYSAQRNYEKAIDEYGKAIKLKPDDATAYSNRGAAYSARKEYEQAIADYSKAIGLRPDYALAYCNRGAVYSAREKYDEAIADYSKAITFIEPRSPYLAGIYYNRGAAYSALKEYDKAKADYDEAIRLNPAFATAP